jgi:hypothetical protein
MTVGLMAAPRLSSAAPTAPWPATNSPPTGLDLRLVLERHRTRGRHPQVDKRVEQEPRAFVWTKTADEILETLAASRGLFSDPRHQSQSPLS